MTIGNRVLPIFRNAGFTSANIETATRAEIEFACCDICKYPGGEEPLNSEPPYLDMCICESSDAAPISRDKR
eukprot:1155566-Pelagomonas_calceolata.AAC.6